MALSYEALKDYDKCIEYARRSTRIRSTAQANAFAAVANCQDDSSDIEGALKTFAEGLKRFPKDVMLNFNYAVSLLRHDQPACARKALRVAIREAPGYPSPYLLYATLLHDQGFTAAGVLMDLRFILAEPESARAMDAASRYSSFTRRKRSAPFSITSPRLRASKATHSGWMRIARQRMS